VQQKVDEYDKQMKQKSKTDLNIIPDTIEFIPQPTKPATRENNRGPKSGKLPNPVTAGAADTSRRKRESPTAEAVNKYLKETRAGGKKAQKKPRQ